MKQMEFLKKSLCNPEKDRKKRREKQKTKQTK